MADDLSWHDLGPYGSTDVPTPNIDRLAREGLRFDLAFQSTAMCAPTRQQFLTGLDPVRSGAYPNHAWVQEGTRSLFHFLADLGYRVGLTGKTHIGPPSSFPFEPVGERQKEPPTAARLGVPPLDLEAAAEFMQRDRSQPFFLFAASHNPHGPWTEGDASVFDRSKLTVPPYLVDTPVTRQVLSVYYAEITALDAQLGALLKVLDESGLAQETLVIFTSEQGSGVPFAKWTLYDAGIRTGLIVRWPGVVRPGTATRAMVQYSDIAPTLIEAAGGAPPRDLDGRSFLSVLTDGAATHREFVFGVHTNRGIIAGGDYPIRAVRSERYKLIENLLPANDYLNALNNSARGRSLVDDWTMAAEAGDEWARILLTAYRNRPRFELYDLESDPFELTNLAEEKALSDVKALLADRLQGWMAQQGDEGIATEHAALDHISPELLDLLRKIDPDTFAPTPR
jgi:uncharacterized sulfatase